MYIPVLKTIKRASRSFTTVTKASLKDFARDSRGNIALMFGILMPVFFMFIGGAVDFSRLNQIKADLTESLDAAGLAVARYDEMAPQPPELEGKTGADREAVLKEFGRRFFDENFRYHDQIIDLNVDFDLSQTAIIPSASGRIKTLILEAGATLLTQQSETQFAYFDIGTGTEITRRGSGKIELALVLDQTGSMNNRINGVKKIDSLQVAVDDLLNVLYGDATSDPNVKVGVIPFNSFTNPGNTTAWQSSWGDTDAQATYHGARFFHADLEPDANSDNQPDIDRSSHITQTHGERTNDGITQYIRPDVKVNHYDLYNSNDDVSWEGCVEARPYPLDELDTIPGDAISATFINDSLDVPSVGDEQNARTRLAFTRAPQTSLTLSELLNSNNSRWVPAFYADEPDCTTSGSVCGQDWGWHTTNYTLMGVPRTIQTRGYMFDGPSAGGDNQGSYGNDDYVEDDGYINRFSNIAGDPFGRYAELVLAQRYVTSFNSSQLSPYWQSVKAQLQSFGVTSRGSHEYRLRNAYVGMWDEDQQKYIGKYDELQDVDESGTNGKDRGPNRSCALPILPLTDDRTDVEDHMETIKPYGNTNIPNGAVWGWRVLSPQAPFTEGVEYTAGDWQKAVVIMTDGANYFGSQNTHFESTFTAYGYAPEERMGDGVDLPRDGGGGWDSDRMDDQADEKLLRICRRMKQEGILVYTIMFGLNDSDTEDVFKACATSPQAPYFFNAPTQQQLQSAFSDIAADLVALHVSQ